MSGNADRGLWALAAVSGAQAQAQSSDSARAWLNPAQTVFDEFTSSWDNSTCNGGLPQSNSIKSSTTNGVFFNLAARLAHSTGNLTDLDWATRVLDWSRSISLIDQTNWTVYDFAQGGDNCSSVERSEWTFNTGFYVSGAAHMYNITSGDTQTKWRTVLDGLVKTMVYDFLPSGIATETCELYEDACNPELREFIGFTEYKGVLGRVLVDTLRVAPYTSPLIHPLLASTAQAAAKACSQGPNGTSCSYIWRGTPRE
jgi:mannan endo-1,6-alpha-mannosidase